MCQYGFDVQHFTHCIECLVVHHDLAIVQKLNFIGLLLVHNWAGADILMSDATIIACCAYV